MNPLFTLKNFRSFGETGATFEMAPLTVLTGCNSAGKSSLTKALMLLNESQEKALSPSLNLYKNEYSLGTFDNVINKKSEKDKFELSYTLFSTYLRERVVVSRVYRKRKDDIFNDAYLVGYTITKEDGSLICKVRHSQMSSLFEEDFQVDESYFRERMNDFDLVSRYWYCIEQSMYADRMKELANTSKGEEKWSTMFEGLEKEIVDLAALIKEHNIPVADYDIDELGRWFAFANTKRDIIEKFKQEPYTSLKDRHSALESAEVDEIRSLNKEMEVFEKFIRLFLAEVCTESEFADGGMKYLGSSNSQIKRIYSIEDNSKLGAQIRRYHHSKMYEEDMAMVMGYGRTFYTGDFLNDWVKKFGIADKIRIKSDGEGSVKVYSVRGTTVRLLADEGYGITHLVSLLLAIDNAITCGEEVEKHDWVVKDSMVSLAYNPCRSESWQYERKRSLICIEEPEVHLHPKYQSMLAEMFVEAYQKYNIHFVIETHSEYLIRKLQVMVADKECKLQSSDVSINYVEKDADGISTNRQIKIEEDGRLSEPFGEGFYDEADSLALELMRFKSRRK